MKQAIAQMGSLEMLVIVSVIQTAIYAVVCSFFGYFLADKTRLWRPLKFEKSKLGHSMLLSAGLGILFSLDYWTFGNAVSDTKETTAPGMTFNGIAANIIAAFFFAAGHLPATITIFGKLTPLLLFRCFLLNGGFGLVFGWFYRRYGLIYAMTAVKITEMISTMNAVKITEMISTMTAATPE